jgi:hypothetical protein
MRRIIAALAVLGALVVPVLFSSPASASVSSSDSDAIPVTSLPSCKAPGDVGGWGVRDFVAFGNRAGNPLAEKRPRSLRLGEPCLDAGGLSLPLQQSEVPVEGYNRIAYDVENGGSDGGGTNGSGGGGGGGGGVGAETDDPKLATTPAVPGGSFCWIRQSLNVANYPDPSANIRECSGVWRATGSTSNTIRGWTNTCPSCTSGSAPIVAYGDVSAQQNTSDPRMMDILIDRLYLSIPVYPAIPSDWNRPVGTVQVRGVCQKSPATSPQTYADSTSLILSVENTVFPRSSSISCGSGFVPLYAFVRDASATTQNSSSGVFYRADGQFVPSASSTSTIGGFESSEAVLGAVSPTFSAMVSTVYCQSARLGSPFPVPVTGFHTSGFEAIAGTNDLGLPTIPADSSDSSTADIAFTWQRLDFLDIGGITQAECPFLQSVEYVVCAFRGSGVEDISCISANWQWVQAKGNVVYPDSDTDVTLCSLPGFWAPYCSDVLYPPYVDYSSFADMCEAGEVPTILSWDTYPFFKHYIDCLFIPRGGWDWKEDIPREVESSALYAVEPVLFNLASSLTFGESCGVLMDGDIFGAPIAINTCTWSWASDIKAFFSVVFILGFGWWAIGFLLATILGIFNKKTPSPVGKDED